MMLSASGVILIISIFGAITDRAQRVTGGLVAGLAVVGVYFGGQEGLLAALFLEALGLGGILMFLAKREALTSEAKGAAILQLGATGLAIAAARFFQIEPTLGTTLFFLVFYFKCVNWPLKTIMPTEGLSLRQKELAENLPQWTALILIHVSLQLGLKEAGTCFLALAAISGVAGNARGATLFLCASLAAIDSRAALLFGPTLALSWLGGWGGLVAGLLIGVAAGFSKLTAYPESLALFVVGYFLVGRALSDFSRGSNTPAEIVLGTAAALGAIILEALVGGVTAWPSGEEFLSQSGGVFPGALIVGVIVFRVLSMKWPAARAALRPAGLLQRFWKKTILLEAGAVGPFPEPGPERFGAISEKSVGGIWISIGSNRTALWFVAITVGVFLSWLLGK